MRTGDGLRILALTAVLWTPVTAQADPSGRWRTLHTEHFRIHFRPDDRAEAWRAAREAERAYGALALELHRPRGIIDLTVSDDFDAANGFTTPWPSNRFTVLLTTPASDAELQRYDSWLRLVVSHELTHVFHLDRTRGPWAVLQHVFGRVPGLFPNEYQPTWVIEGLAVHYETRLTGGGRAAASFHQQLLGAAAGGDAARTPWTAQGFSAWPAGIAPYAYGGRFFHYLAATRGDSAVSRFIEQTSGQWIPYRVGRPLRLADGLAGFDTAFASATRPRPAAGPSSTRLLGALRENPRARVSPDGQRVAYLQSDGRSAARLVVATLPALRTIRSHRVNAVTGFDWLGDTVVVTQLDFVTRWRVRSDLYRWTPDGRWHRVSRGARLTEPHGGGATLATVAITPAGNRVVLPGVPSDPSTTWGEVAPAPGGRTIVATRHRDGQWALVRWRVGAFPAAGPDVLYRSATVVTDPAWTADGAVLFVTEVGGYPQILRWREDGEVTVLSDAPYGARSPAALADGSMLYSTFGVDGWELRHVTPRRGEAAPVSAAPAAFDSAPPVQARETGYAAWPSLRPHFWVPLGLDAGAAGRFAGVATVGTDALQRYVYGAQALYAFDRSRASGGFVFISNAWSNPTLDLSASNDWSLTGITGGGTVVSNESRDAALGFTFAGRRWRSSRRLRVALEYEGTRYVALPDTPLVAVCIGCRTRDEVGGSISLGLASYVGAPLAVSRQNGYTLGVLYRRREQQGSARWSNEVRGQLALYAALPATVGFGRSVFALRVTAGGTSGPSAKRYGVGGVTSGVLDLGFGAVVGTARDFPVRGYVPGAVFGHRAATVSFECRLPVALIGQSLGHLPLGADWVSLSGFLDAGNAWEPGAAPHLTRLLSGGGELVANLVVSYEVPLRVALGAAVPLVAPPAGGARRPRAYVTVGTTF